MKAMVLAAGKGVRLRPLTEERPKALIDIEGVPMLELVLRRLISAGVTEAIVNVFHLPEMIAEFLKSKENFGIRIELSRESELLDTGGGLKKAAWFFDDGKPFFLHNSDVLSDVDLGALYAAHAEKDALATLAVRARASRRQLLFDEKGLLCGWEAGAGQQLVRPAGKVERLAFLGIHVVSPALFPEMPEGGVFSIIKPYLGLAARGGNIRAFRCDGRFWRDIGSPEKLEEARRLAREKGLPS